MPGGNRRGPYGLGTMTGRAAGYCAGFTVPGYLNHAGGRGFFGRGRGGGGRGRGFRNMFWATGLPGWARSFGVHPGWPVSAVYQPFPGSAIPPEQEADALKNQVKYMQDSISALNERIKELSAAESKDES